MFFLVIIGLVLVIGLGVLVVLIAGLTDGILSGVRRLESIDKTLQASPAQDSSLESGDEP